jgi:hypothetical protein
MTRFENVGVFIREKVWLRLFSSQTFYRINTPTFSDLVILRTYPPMKLEQTECSETLACQIQTLGNYPDESIKMYAYQLHNFLRNWLGFLCSAL